MYVYFNTCINLFMLKININVSIINYKKKSYICLQNMIILNLLTYYVKTIFFLLKYTRIKQ